MNTQTDPDGFVPSVDSVLEAAALIEAAEHHDPAFGHQLFAATTGTTYALALMASHTISTLAKLLEVTPDEALREIRGVTTEVVALLTSEGEAA